MSAVAFAFAFAILIGAQTVGVARATEFSTDAGLTLNPILSGSHESYNDRTAVPPVPIPLVEVNARYGALELDLESLPPVASIRSFDRREGHTSTRLSLVDGMLRIWDPQHHFSAGIGQTSYNQSTHYVDPIEQPGTGETQFSHITGASYGAGYQLMLGHGRLQAFLNYAPAMLGTQYTLFATASLHRRADPERAQQIDTAVRYMRPAGRSGELTLGLRYINFTATYAEPHGGLADRNVGLLAVIGYRRLLPH